MRALAFLLALAPLVTGCGPVQSTAALIDADVEIEAARAAGAPTTDAYDFTAAEAYLHEAREQAGYAQYEASARFASEARERAAAAKKKAIETSNRPEAQ